MSEETKLMLSADELALAKDRNVILTKRAVMEKVAALFGNRQAVINETFRAIVADNGIPVSPMPKISKGENYKGFPYVIMDHPAAFKKDNIFAVRTMFWWGNFISITLHLSGEYRELFKEKIFTNISPDIFIAAGTDEWHHDLEDENFCLVSELTPQQKARIAVNDFLKIAIRYDLDDWKGMGTLLEKGYRQIANLII